VEKWEKGHFFNLHEFKLGERPQRERQTTGKEEREDNKGMPAFITTRERIRGEKRG